MADDTPRASIPVWRPRRARRLAATLLYPVFRLLNRPAFAGFGRAAYEFALRCNGIAINYEGRHGLTFAEERFLTRLAPTLQGGTLLDVGANVGTYAAYLARVAPTATIHAFEPHPRTFAHLESRVAGMPITAWQAALSDKAGTTTLYDHAARDGSTQASLSQPAVALFDGDIVAHDVVCTTLDDFIAKHGISRVALLKIDTEGLDLSVLRGARRAIEARVFQCIQFEFISANIATGVRMRDFFDLLQGYRIYRVCLNGGLVPLFPYSVMHTEIYVTQTLVAQPH